MIRCGGRFSSMANALASAGIRRGDAVAIALPNGLPAIVSFLAASIAGKAAPLNPAYPYEEFHFFLGDTNARVLLCPPVGCGVRSHGRRGPQDPSILGGNERERQRAPDGCAHRSYRDEPYRGRHCVDPAHQRKHGKTQAGSLAAFQPGGFLGKYCEHLRAFRGRRLAVHHAAVPYSRADWFHHGYFAFRWRRGSAHQIQCALFLAHRARASGDVVFGSAHDAPASYGANSPQACGGCVSALHSFLQRAAFVRTHSQDRRVSSACLSSKPTE